jgi:hypothetical protein
MPNDAMNTIGSGLWEVEVKPGEKLDLTVDYQTYARVR